MSQIDHKNIQKEFQQLQKQLSESDVYQKPDYPKLAKRHKQLESVIQCLDQQKDLLRQIEQTEKLLQDQDQELAVLAEKELKDLKQRLLKIQSEIENKLENQADKTIVQACLIEIRAGVGGDEASLFAADLYRMYIRYADKQGWKTQSVSHSPSEAGGYKEIVFEINHPKAYHRLNLESGVHRVQRVPSTESQGRIHTSTASVAVLAKAKEADLKLEPAELRIDTYRSSGHGGQSVNKTDSAVRVTHLPSGLIVTCQDEKSQFKNKSKALDILRSRLLQSKLEKQAEEASSKRQKLIGKAMRMEKIRTYNFPQNRITDHRISFSSNNLTAVLNGQLDQFIDRLQEWTPD